MKQRDRLLLIAFVATCSLMVAAAGCRGRDAEDVEMQVRNVGFDRGAASPVVILEAADGARLLPIWIGPMEAQSIALEMQKVAPPRPLTHDLVKRILDGTGVVLRRVRITALEQQTFFATIVLDQGGREIEIDSRASDAIALALRAPCPILVSRTVLESRAAMRLPDPGAATVARVWGATVQDLAPSVAESLGAAGVTGVVVTDVEESARNAGLRRGDVIVRVDAVPVLTAAEVRALAVSDAGVRHLEVRRDGARITVDVDATSSAPPRG